MAIFVLLEAWSRLRGEWRCVCKEGGVVCVAQVGTTRMHLLCADNWVILQQVWVIWLCMINTEAFYAVYIRMMPASAVYSCTETEIQLFDSS